VKLLGLLRHAKSDWDDVSLRDYLDADAVRGRFEGDVYYRPAPTAAFLHCNGADGTFDLIRRAGGG